MTIIRWRRFTVGHLTQTPERYLFSESFERIVDFEGIFIKIKLSKNQAFPNIALYFPEYRGSLKKFVYGRI